MVLENRGELVVALSIERPLLEVGALRYTRWRHLHTVDDQRMQIM